MSSPGVPSLRGLPWVPIASATFFPSNVCPSAVFTRKRSPSRAADFTSADKTTALEIAFPKSDKAYRIITRQDVGALETAPDDKGRIKGGIKIKDADKFWAASRFLILLEQ